MAKQIAKKPRRRVSKPWKELVKQKEGLMRTLKEKRKGNEEAELKQQDQMQTLQKAFLQQQRQQTQAMRVLLERLGKK